MNKSSNSSVLQLLIFFSSKRGGQTSPENIKSLLNDAISGIKLLYT